MSAVAVPPLDLAVASMGDPHDRRTWSGAVRHLVLAMEARGVNIHGIDVSFGPREKLWHFTRYQLARARRGLLRPDALAIPARFRSDYELYRVARAARAEHVVDAARARGVRQVLHMTLNALPLTRPTPDLNHAAFIDTTWHLNLHTLEAARRFGPRLNAEIIELERRAFAQLDHVFTMAGYIARDVADFYGVPERKITVINTGIGQPFASPGPKDYSRPTILFVAKLRFEEKGGALLLEAFRRARAQRPDLRLILVGQDQYRRFADVPGVEAHGHVSRETLEALYHEASLFAMPALLEPWGLVYVEALANRLPVVGLRRGALPEITENGRHGFLVPDPDPDALAATLLDALSDPARLREMGERGQAHVLSSYSWERSADLLLGAWPVRPSLSAPHREAQP